MSGRGSTDPRDHPEVVPPARVTPFGPSWSPIFIAFDRDILDGDPIRMRFGLSADAAEKRHARSQIRDMKRSERRERRSRDR